jgi:hypothetical protein
MRAIAVIRTDHAFGAATGEVTGAGRAVAGFEVAVVKDVTAAPRHPQLGDGDPAVLVNSVYSQCGHVNRRNREAMAS